MYKLDLEKAEEPEIKLPIFSTSCKVLGWMKHKLESKLPGGISITADMPHL